jgi:hypothetical protein
MTIRETASEFATEIMYLTGAFFVRNAVVLVALSAAGLLSLSFP